MSLLGSSGPRRRWITVASWLAFLVVANLAALLAGGAAYDDSIDAPGTDSSKVLALMKGAGLSKVAGFEGTVVVHPTEGTLHRAHPPAGLVEQLEALCTDDLHVTVVSSPWGRVTCAASPTLTPYPARTPRSRQSALLSRDRTVGLIEVHWEEGQSKASNFTGVVEHLEKLRTDTMEYEFTGTGFSRTNGTGQGGIPPEVFGMLAALVIMLLVFRTLSAALLPLATTIVALGSGLAVISLLSHVLPISSAAEAMTPLIVLGVGVDYALFIVTRHRRNLLAGMGLEASIDDALKNTGRAVMFAGATVCVAVSGLAFLGLTVFYGVALGIVITVGLAMIASITLLPALLGLIGYRVLPRNVRRQVRAGMYVAGDKRSFWDWWSEIVARHRILLGTGALLLIGLMTIPLFSMRLGLADERTNPPGSTTHRGFDLIAEGFGTGYNSSLQLVVSGGDATNPGLLAKVAKQLAEEEDVDPGSIRPTPLGRDLTIIVFKSLSGPQDEATSDLIHRLRDDFAPAVERGTASQIYVFGQTALFADLTSVISGKMVGFFTAIIGLSVLLLMIAFRSILIPLTAAAMNLLAAGASFGLLVAIFQWGWGYENMGMGIGGPIDPFVPVIFFAILFGLSIDYQVFLISRIQEEWLQTRDNRRSIIVGQCQTGGIITAAALIMMAVFFGFLLGDARLVKLVGVGLGGAVFIDAFILRTVLVPAVMHTFGNANWYYPAWLERITPRLSLEAPHPEEPVAADESDKLGEPTPV